MKGASLGVILWTFATVALADSQDSDSESAPVVQGTPRAWALAVDALQIQDNGLRHDLLGGSPRIAAVQQTYRQSIGRAWGVRNTDSLLKTLTWLYDHGHHEQVDRLNAYVERQDPLADPTQLFHLLIDPEARRRIEFVRLNSDRLHEHSILAWDMVRYVTLCRWGYLIGYLTEEQAWPLIMKAAFRVQSSFDSWQSMTENFLLGREFWDEDEYRQRLPRARAINDNLLNDPASPWRQNPWNMNLNPGAS